MQTFLPWPGFDDSARVLDRQRLGKQRVETLQILRSLTGTGGWANHPAVKMWSGHEVALFRYQVAVCREWTSRGYRDTCLVKSLDTMVEWSGSCSVDDPPWLGNPDFHRSHRSNLLRKSESYAEHFEPDLPDNLEYVWPVARSSSPSIAKS